MVYEVEILIVSHFKVIPNQDPLFSKIVLRSYVVGTNEGGSLVVMGGTAVLMCVVSFGRVC